MTTPIVFEIPMEQHTKPGAVVLEPFNGSGSHIIAAEKIGRRCYACEITPTFVDGTVLRWEKATGKHAAPDPPPRAPFALRPHCRNSSREPWIRSAIDPTRLTSGRPRTTTVGRRCRLRDRARAPKPSRGDIIATQDPGRRSDEMDAMQQRNWTVSASLALSWAALLACGLVGQETAPAHSPDRAAATEPRTKLEQKLLQALADDDPEIRAIAAWFFGFAGEPRHAAAIGALVQDDNSEVRKRVLEGLRMLGCREAAPFLVEGLRDGVTGVRLQALSGLLGCARAEDRAEIEARLGDTDWQVRIFAAQVLAAMGTSGLSAECADLLGACAEGGPGMTPRMFGTMDRQLAACLDLLTEPAHANALRPLLRSEDPRARFAAKAAAERLVPDAVASRPRAGALAAWEREREFRRENKQAIARLRVQPWREVALEDLVRAAQGARLVVFGETHSTGGPLRAAQVRLLRAWAGVAVAGAALGFEPSVEVAQRQTIDAARELGLAVIPLEKGWEQLLEEARHGARDDLTRTAIDAWLSAGPERRMFVIRGEAHVVPGGFLLRGLKPEPVVVSSQLPIPLRARGEKLSTNDRVWTIGGSGRVFRWGCVDNVGRGVDKLPGWLEQH